MLRLQRVEGNCYDPSLQPEKILLKPTVTRLGRSNCHDSVNSKGLLIVRTRLPPRVYSLSPKSSKYKDVHPPSGVTV